MKVSREQMQVNRGLILDAASALFREKGFDAVSVAEVMKAAGFTHGGFYGHFQSKDDLIVQTIAHIFGRGQEVGRTPPDLDAYLDAYLSPHHRDNSATGCPTAALVADVGRQGPEARQAMTDGFRSQIQRIADAISKTDPGAARHEAVGTWSALVGALLLSRTIEDPALSRQVLDDTRAWISEQNPNRVN
ncbi:TetR/AcrR family transcriptional regulator [uncultured Brevundimonas sp.]|uniref:TetR/AcrR family transcriptional regulator n=1 Tax=uncultured Brevundimonas sp. TaxID=213418 RepID=UPI0025D2D141|nr:TetR/AcrR family transcriptional regulator [uncultured Brevundimonas sp.]